eukprot:c254_g1_i1 orf=331-1323(-)
MTTHPIEEATTDSIFGTLSADQFYIKHDVKHEQEFMENSRGMKIFTQSWRPTSARLTGVVLILHGFTVDSSWTVQLTAVGIAKRGFSVHALDFEGHGRSEGRTAYIPDLNTVVDDCIQFFGSVKQQHPDLPAFLYGESLGAAAALLIHFRQPNDYNGAVLHGAMCGISPKFIPPWPLLHLLPLAATVIPTWRVCPTRDNATLSFKENWKLKLVKSSPYKKVGRPDAATGYDMIRVAEFIQSRLRDVSLPFFAVHGEEDRICDPEAVKDLYEKASSRDKTLKTYKGMWHMYVGESRETTNLVFSDILDWLQARAETAPLKQKPPLLNLHIP